MYNNILVPIDSSPTSQRGLDEAIALAKLAGASLRLIHVVDELSFAMSAGYGMTYTGDLPGTRGRRGVGRLFIDSDAENIVRSAPVPVLLIRAAPADKPA